MKKIIKRLTSFVLVLTLALSSNVLVNTKADEEATKKEFEIDFASGDIFIGEDNKLNIAPVTDRDEDYLDGLNFGFYLKAIELQSLNITSSNKDVATVVENEEPYISDENLEYDYKLVPNNSGKATITLETTNYKQTIEVVVEDKIISINDLDEMSLILGANEKLPTRFAGSRVKISEEGYVSEQVEELAVDTSLITYTSQDPKIVTVDEKGITAVGTGKTNITASYEVEPTTITLDGKEVELKEITFNIPVTVKQYPSKISFENVLLNVEKGKTATQNYKVIPAENILIEDVKWSSSDTKVAVVDGNGVVTAKSSGSAVISVSMKGVANGEVSTITATYVVAVPVEETTKQPEKVKVYKNGDKKKIKVNATHKKKSKNLKIKFKKVKGATVYQMKVYGIQKNGIPKKLMTFYTKKTKFTKKSKKFKKYKRITVLGYAWFNKF